MIALGYGLAFIIGLSLGLLGGGGSILTVPVLHYVLRFGVREAIPMSLVVVGLTSGFGAVAHHRSGTVDFRAAMLFAPAAIVGALLGAELGLRTSPVVQLTVFAVVMILAAISMWLGHARLQERETAPATRHPLPYMLLLGGAVGLLTGFAGVGGGFLYVPALVLLAGLPMKRAVGTSLVLILLSCMAGFARYQGSLALDWRSIVLFTAIAFAGVATGSRMVRRISTPALRRGFALLLLVMGVVVLTVGR
ncbi:MAG: sulfite exporter TauE/SafE family protein [Gemmatimonadales bacterium]